MKHPARKEPSPIVLRVAEVAAPARLLEGGSSSGSSRTSQAIFERRLLASAAVDEIPLASLERLAAAFDVAAVARPAPGLPRGGPRALRFGKAGWFVALGAIGVVGAVVASGGFEGRASAPERAAESVAWQPAQLPSVVQAPEPTGLRESPTLLPTREAVGLATAAPQPPRARTGAAAHRLRSAKPGVESNATAQPREPAGLREELRRLEAVQNDLRAGRPKDAARGLDDYARAFPAGELGLEAELLEVDVSLARGDRARALAVAQRMLARPGAQRYRARLEALLDASASVAPPAAPASGVIRSSTHMKEVEVTR